MKLIKYIIKTLKFLKNEIIYWCDYFRILFFQVAFSMFPINKRKIVLTNFYGRGYGDSEKYIVEELLKRDLNLDIVWLINNTTSVFPDKIRLVKYKSIKAIFELTTARILIDNCRKKDLLIKRKRQYYIQTWHASLWLKKVELDSQDSLSKRYIKCAKRDSKMTDLMSSGNTFVTELFRNHFWYSGEIVEYGTPRIDILMKSNESIKEKVCSKYNIFNKKIVLYAPTFRNATNLECYNIDFDELKQFMNKKFKQECIILFRLHPNLIKYISLDKYSGIIDVSEYEDIQELLCVSDILVTDYSSVMFEFSYTGKPVFLYANDVDQYKKDKGFYFDIFDLPYTVARNTEELIKNIDEFDEVNYNNTLSVFFKNIGLLEDGAASSRIADRIEQKLEES